MKIVAEYALYKCNEIGVSTHSIAQRRVGQRRVQRDSEIAKDGAIDRRGPVAKEELRIAQPLSQRIANSNNNVGSDADVGQLDCGQLRGDLMAAARAHDVTEGKRQRVAVEFSRDVFKIVVVRPEKVQHCIVQSIVDQGSERGRFGALSAIQMRLFQKHYNNKSIQFQYCSHIDVAVSQRKLCQPRAPRRTHIANSNERQRMCRRRQFARTVIHAELHVGHAQRSVHAEAARLKRRQACEKA